MRAPAALRRNILEKFPPAAERLVQRDIRNRDGQFSDGILPFKLVLLARRIEHVQEIRDPLLVTSGVEIQCPPAGIHSLAKMLDGFHLRPITHQRRVHLIDRRYHGLAIVGEKLACPVFGLIDSRVQSPEIQ